MSDSERTFVEIPLDELHDSPFNPPERATRRLEEITASIVSEGRILEPLLVRPRVVHGGQQGFEIVYGHRRRRGAEAAGLATAPCEVRAMTDEEVRSAQAAENLQRVDLRPYEEAEAYAAMIELDGLSRTQLAERVSMSESHVAARLQLLKALPEIRTAVEAGDLGSEDAVLVARLRTHKLQADALRHLKAHNAQLDDGGKMSHRRVRELIAERYQLALKDALFDPTDSTLLPEAGTCTECPKRSGNAPEFADVVAETPTSPWRPRAVGPDVCTDPDCFAAKRAAHLKREAEALQAKGEEVVSGNRARTAVGADGKVKGGYVALKDVRAELKRVAKGAQPTVVSIQNPRDGKVVKAVKLADLEAAGVKPPAAKEKAARTPDYAKQREESEAQAAQMNRERLALIDQVLARAAETPRSWFDLQLVAEFVLDQIDHEAQQHLADRLGIAFDRGALVQHLESLSGEAAGLLMLHALLLQDSLVDNWSVGQSQAESLQAAAAHYGASTPSTAGASEGRGRGKGKKSKSKKEVKDEEQNDDAGVAGEDEATGGLFERARA